MYLDNTVVASSRVRTFLWRWSESTPAYILHPHRQASLLSPNKDTIWALSKVRKQHKREKSLASNYSTVIPFRPLSIQHMPARNLWHLCPKSRHYMGHSIQSTYAYILLFKFFLLLFPRSTLNNRSPPTCFIQPYWHYYISSCFAFLEKRYGHHLLPSRDPIRSPTINMFYLTFLVQQQAMQRLVWSIWRPRNERQYNTRGND